ncbi:MAG: EAL domain-containing protein [Solirubrobacterales bacterium]
MESAETRSGGSTEGTSGAARGLRRELLATVDVDGRFISLNDAWERVLGWRRDELMATVFIDLVHPDDVERTLAVTVRGDQRQRELVDFENRYRTRDGDYRWLSWHGYSDGATWVVAAADITDDKLIGDDFKHAIAEGRLLAYGQPILDWRTGEIVEHELLARLRGRRNGHLFAAHEFLPQAERSGAIGLIDRWMTMRGLELAEGGRSVAVNLSARSLADPDLMEELIAAVENHRRGAERVVFEITESAALSNVDAAREIGERLGRLGCQIALDDFGTGFGSLTHLRELPVQIVKIDARFVAGMASEPADRALVQGVASMARALGLRTVAEGIEDEITYALAREYEIDRVQGHLVGEPAPL